MIVGGFSKIPEAMKTHMAAQSFSLSPTWERRTQVYAEAEKSGDLRAVVAPIDRTAISGTRARKAYDWLCGVFVIQSLLGISEADRTSKEDAILAFVDEVAEEMEGMKTITVESAAYPVLLPSEQTAPVEHESLRHNKVFVATAQFVVKDQ